MGRPGTSNCSSLPVTGQSARFLVSASVTPGNIVICSAIDITARKLAEQVIERARDDLEAEGE